MKNNTFLTTALGLLLAGNIASAATVTNTVNLGGLATANIGNTYRIGPYIAGPSYLALGDSFIDTYLFNVASNAFVAGSTVSIDIGSLYNIGNLAASFYDANNSLISNVFNLSSTTNGGIQVNSLYLDTTLMPGNDYKFVLSGTVNGVVGGSYGGVLQATALPIPEADNYLLLLAGLGMVGMISRRRKTQGVAA